MTNAQQVSRLTELIRKQGPSLVLYARQWLTSPEDVVQEAYLDLLAQENWPDNSVAWLYRAVKNRALNQIRSTKRRQHHEKAARQLKEVWFEASFSDRLEGQEIASAVKQLPSVEREVVISRIWGELTFEEIGELIQASPATAFRRYQDGLRTVKATLVKETAGHSEPHNKISHPTK